MSTCNRLDLQTLGSQPITPKNLPDHSDIESVKILVILNPTGYKLTSSGFDAFIHFRYIS